MHAPNADPPASFHAPIMSPRPHPRRARGAMVLLCGLLASAALAGPFDLLGPKGGNADQKRSSVQKESQSMLDQLYTQKPEMKEKLKKAAGYATFSKTDVHLLLVASGNGYGMLVDNKTGGKTYMRVASLGGGVGMGVSDLRVIFVFNDPDVMSKFLEQGLQFATKADASAKHKDVGVAASQSAKANIDYKDGTVSGAATGSVRAGDGKSTPADSSIGVGGGMEIYEFTQSGISLQATIAGTKYWKDSDLNK